MNPKGCANFGGNANGRLFEKIEDETFCHLTSNRFS